VTFYKIGRVEECNNEKVNSAIVENWNIT